jgi:hypothetical protein
VLSCIAPNSPVFYAIRFWRSANGDPFTTAESIAVIYGSANATLTYSDPVGPGTFDYWATAENAFEIGSEPIGPSSATVT